MSQSPPPTACPSSACRPGATLVGVVLPNGRIAYAADRIVVDETFVRAAHEGRPPEQRFRFSTPCMNSGCQQWNGHECGLIDRLLAEYERQFGPPTTDDLPDCPIRPDCRWFLQRGGRSCAVCEILVTDVELTDHDLPREVAARRATYADAGLEDSGA
jgi:hypothetical protein